MQVLREPPNPASWGSRINCQCGAELVAGVSDIHAKHVAERFGMMDVVYSAQCPFCKRRHTIRNIPQHIIDAINRPRT